MSRLNGGYALLDLTKYDLSVLCTNIETDGIEITKEEFDNIKKIINDSYAHSKPLIIKASNLYDGGQYQHMMSMSLNIYVDNVTIGIPYYDMIDNKMLIINITSNIANKYLIGVKENLES